MASTSKRPTTPLRRISRGSLSASVSRGVRGAGGETPLAYLEDAISTLANDTAVLQSNLEQIDSIYNALGTFNESFASYLYGLNMNAFCVEWGEAPQEENFQRAAEREAMRGGAVPIHRYSTGTSEQAGGGYADHSVAVQSVSNVADQTYVTQDDSFQEPPPPPALKPALKKPAAATSAKPTGAAGAPPKGKITIAQRKKRETYANQIIEALPLEYRGSDPAPRQLAQTVLMALIASGQKGIRIAEIVKGPTLTQAKVNKMLIALVAAKHVTKRSDNGIVYTLDPNKHPSLPS